MIIIIGISLFCYIGQKHIFNWIVSDDSVILSAENLILWLFVMALTKVGYQIYMVYLQGIGKERDILQSTIAAMIIASISIVVSGKVFFTFWSLFCYKQQISHLIDGLFSTSKIHGVVFWGTYLL